MVVCVENNDSNMACIYPNCIKNRPDLLGLEPFELLRYTDPGEEITVTVRYVDNIAYLGLYMVPLSEKAVKQFIQYIFKHNKQINLIRYEYSYQKPGENIHVHNHFRIRLPETVEQLEGRLSKKGRYNIAREKRILEQTFGTWSVMEYAFDDDKALPVWEQYFDYKSLAYGEHWRDSTRDEYCRNFGVSTVYVLTLGAEKHIGAIVLSCEQCPEVYIDNLTYDPELAKYSLGQILYDEYLQALIRKGRKELFLLGGNYSYKKRYGSLEEQVYSGQVIRNAGWIRCKVFVWNLLVKLKLLPGEQS